MSSLHNKKHRTIGISLDYRLAESNPNILARHLLKAKDRKKADHH